MKANDGKHAVVLSSGGADGAYAVGVMKALFSGQSPATAYQPLQPGVFVGSSIGAFNAAFLVSQAEGDAAAAVAGLEQVWLEEMAENPRICGNGGFRIRGNPFRIFDPRCFAANPAQSLADLASDSVFLARDWLARAQDFVTSDEPLAQRSFRLVNLGSFITPDPFLRLIERTIRFAQIRQTATVLRISATNWSKGSLKDFANEEMTDEAGSRIVAASAALPGFFPPVELGGDVYVDAAVLGYTRLAPAIEAGAETLHVIYVDPDVENIPLAALQHTFDTLYRVFVIEWGDNVNASIDAVARINRQIEAVEEAILEAALSEAVANKLRERLLSTGRARPQPSRGPVDLRRIAVHRYRPRDDPFGPLGLLDFNRQRLAGLVARGFDDAVKHDCSHSRCVLV